MTQSVTIGAKETKEVTFTFKARRRRDELTRGRLTDGSGGMRGRLDGCPPHRALPPSCPARPMLHRFAKFVAGCTVLLVLAGSLVTSTGSGLSVPDWPTTYGWNMFTFPPSKWVGGILYEHGHRLIASTVGFLTIVLAAWLWLRGAAPLDEVARRRRARRGHRPGRARRA